MSSRMQVLALTKYGRLGPSSRVRFMQFQPALHGLGVDVIFAPLISDAELQRRFDGGSYDAPRIGFAYAKRTLELVKSRRFDLLWIEGQVFPWLPAWIDRLQAISGRPYVVDYDDAIFHQYDRSMRAVVRWTLGEKIATIMRGAATVVAGNAYLARYAASARAKRIVEIPSVVDTTRYSSRRQTSPGPLRVGWVGTPGTTQYVADIARPLREILGPRGGKLVLVGAARDQIWDLPIEICEWAEDTEVATIQTFDIGVMPLPDNPITRGKCGYKLIQYMACGIPAIASPVGANRSIIEEGRTGYLATSGSEWREHLEILADDPALRARLGKQGRERAHAAYSVDFAAPLLADTFARAVRQVR